MTTERPKSESWYIVWMVKYGYFSGRRIGATSPWSPTRAHASDLTKERAKRMAAIYREDEKGAKKGDIRIIKVTAKAKRELGPAVLCIRCKGSGLFGDRQCHECEGLGSKIDPFTEGVPASIRAREGYRLYTLRRKAGLTREVLAVRLGFSVGATDLIARLEGGGHDPRSDALLKSFEKICNQAIAEKEQSPG